MSRRWSRRELLAVSGLGGLAALAGCANPLASGSVSHPVTVANKSSAVHNVFVRIEDGSGKALFLHMYRLDGGSTDSEHESFLGMPAKVVVTVDGTPPRKLTWPSKNCSNRNDPGGVAITISSKGDVNVHGTCEG